MPSIGRTPEDSRPVPISAATCAPISLRGCPVSFCRARTALERAAHPGRPGERRGLQQPVGEPGVAAVLQIEAPALAAVRRVRHPHRASDDRAEGRLQVVGAAVGEPEQVAVAAEPAAEGRAEGREMTLIAQQQIAGAERPGGQDQNAAAQPVHGQRRQVDWRAFVVRLMPYVTDLEAAVGGLDLPHLAAVTQLGARPGGGGQEVVVEGVLAAGVAADVTSPHKLQVSRGVSSCRLGADPGTGLPGR